MQSVYHRTMVHRAPGDTGTLPDMERLFPACTMSVNTEDMAEAALVEQSSPIAVPDTQTATSFTRTIITDVKPNILQQIKDADALEKLARQLADVYHYYLHGNHGGMEGTSDQPKATTLPNNQTLPTIQVEMIIVRHFSQVDNICLFPMMRNKHMLSTWEKCLTIWSHC